MSAHILKKYSLTPKVIKGISISISQHLLGNICYSKYNLSKISHNKDANLFNTNNHKGH